MIESSIDNQANRFIYMTLIDFAKAEGDIEKAI